MNFFPMHIGDYAVHTRHLSLLEDLAYRRLLDLYYTHEKPIPLEAAARLIGMRDHQAEVADVLEQFFTRTENGWWHQRCEEELARMRAKQENARDSVAKRAAAKAEAEAKRARDAADADARRKRDASVTPASSTNTNTNTTTNKRRTPLPLAGGVDAGSGFDTFWLAYPAIGNRKAAKPQCLAKWKTKGCATFAARIMRALEAQKASPKWGENAGEFVPAPLVWLNQERWTASEEAEAAAPEWWETAKGANTMAKQLGVALWDECEPFTVYRDRLRNLTKERQAA